MTRGRLRGEWKKIFAINLEAVVTENFVRFKGYPNGQGWTREVQIGRQTCDRES
jgi:hypothetical protein